MGVIQGSGEKELGTGIHRYFRVQELPSKR